LGLQEHFCSARYYQAFLLLKWALFPFLLDREPMPRGINWHTGSRKNGKTAKKSHFLLRACCYQQARLGQIMEDGW